MKDSLRKNSVFRRKRKSFDRSIIQRGMAVLYASNHAPNSSCSVLRRKHFSGYTARLCELVLLLHRRRDSSYLIRLLQVRTVKDTLRKQGFQNPQHVGEGAVWVWLIQLLIEAMTTKSLM